MGFKSIELKMPPYFTAEELRHKIGKTLHLKKFSYTIEKQSLDARNKRHIHWRIKLGISAPALKGPVQSSKKKLSIPYKKSNRRIIIVGSGPAGFFAAYILQKAGFRVSLLEQGSEVNIRFKCINTFERTGELHKYNNYSFGEGGAGTFSDGKLTSRTKSISIERQFIFETYIEAGGPPEIAYMNHPHLGSDNLRKIVKNLRKLFTQLGGEIYFDTQVKDITFDQQRKRILTIDTDRGRMDADDFIFAIGHSSFETYRMLIRKGIPFRVKAFALGCRVEHLQEFINRAQWGRASIPGLKAAEYRFTFKPQSKNLFPVYSFCMCPGGKVVPAAAYEKSNIVNGMSNYRRNSPFANAAIVAGTHFNRLLNREVEPLEALDRLEELERDFYDFSQGYTAPACKISDFLEGKTTPYFSGTSYPFGLNTADFSTLLPKKIINSLKEGLKDFCRKIKGFEVGLMLGLESKTSSPIQVVREENGKISGLENFYIAGEGSGYTGGIISSAADGIKSALQIIAVEGQRK